MSSGPFTSSDYVDKNGATGQSVHKIAERLSGWKIDEGHILLLNDSPAETVEQLAPLLQHTTKVLDASNIPTMPELAATIYNTVAEHVGESAIEVIPEQQDNEQNWSARYQWFHKTYDYLNSAYDIANEHSEARADTQDWYLTIFVYGMSDEVADRFKRFRDELWSLGRKVGLVVIAPPEQVNWYLYWVSESWCWPQGVYKIELD